MGAATTTTPIWGRNSVAMLAIAILSISMIRTSAGDVLDDVRVEASSELKSKAAPPQSSGDTISIEDFSDPTMKWRTMNDPVMGGQSKSSVAIGDGMAHFEGTCAIVPFLNAPGFITMTTGVHYPPGSSLLRNDNNNNGFGNSRNRSDEKSLFPDVSNCKGLSVTLRSTVDYHGYFVSFGTDRVPGGHHASGYKTSISLRNSEEFEDLRIPFSDFSSDWDDATGDTKVSCLENSKYCPSVATLKDMQTISFWGEGVEGTVALDVVAIGAYGCASSSSSDNDNDIGPSAIA
jgi:hypothetical protein